ncbi:hypothetical protein Runsl_3910 [Runella slithyformis DSM 19594]|uniref:Uncharacterized protein n=1 Tax=Runella slithyformis (strain ATCC 29530 / DSM 19594 / LMG 11500 / NCIMB 11436 / LSU 4) TaxID=761193 RepID=A0A7U3ZN45_RUNSL|nr:hypothetical protein Runsl_3910 [Runella slithyformis DSM 19594]
MYKLPSNEKIKSLNFAKNSEFTESANLGIIRNLTPNPAKHRPRFYKPIFCNKYLSVTFYHFLYIFRYFWLVFVFIIQFFSLTL